MSNKSSLYKRAPKLYMFEHLLELFENFILNKWNRIACNKGNSLPLIPVPLKQSEKNEYACS